jgi:hypothetical protein
MDGRTQMKNLICALVTLLLINSWASAKCIPANEYVPFVGKAAQPSGGQVALGMYTRVSPDGKYILRSFSGDHLSTVTLMEIFKQADGTKAARAYETKFNNEAYPVQGSWRFICNYNGDHYRVKDVITLGKGAKEQLSGGISGFYTAAAELPGGSDERVQIRSLSWPNQRGNGSDEQGVGQLTNASIIVRKNADGSYSKTDSSKVFSMCDNIKNTEGSIYSLPMISSDGTEFSALPQNPSDHRLSMRVYKFGADNKTCEKVDDLSVPASKAIFGFAQTGKKAPIVFLSSTNVGNTPVYGIHLYDRELRRTFFLGDRTKWLTMVDAFPGMTKDGRIIYGARWKDCANCTEQTGYVIADLFQSDDVKKFKQQSPDQAKNFKQCVTEEDVAKVEADQAVLYGFSK